jgi:hypothetical protein
MIYTVFSCSCLQLMLKYHFSNNSSWKCRFAATIKDATKRTYPEMQYKI